MPRLGRFAQEWLCGAGGMLHSKQMSADEAVSHPQAAAQAKRYEGEAPTFSWNARRVYQRAVSHDHDHDDDPSVIHEP